MIVAAPQKSTSEKPGVLISRSGLMQINFTTEQKR